MTTPTILLFTRDLRLSDHPALAAAATDGPVVPLFVWTGSPSGDRLLGAASRWWLAGSLEALARALEAKGSRLLLRRGELAAEVLAVAAITGARTVHMTRGYEPGAQRQSGALETALAKQGIGLTQHSGRLLIEPEKLATKSGTPFKVFTPFWRAVQEHGVSGRFETAGKLAAPKRWPASDRLEDWGLRPSKPNWANGFTPLWQPGEEGAWQSVERLIDGPLGNYGELRNRPDIDGTSRLSPHLAFSEISPRQLWHRLTAAAAADPALQSGADAWLRELAWREFSYHLMHHWPSMTERALRQEFRAFPFRTDASGLKAWQKGQTGYPYIDAGLRELWATGWMHNRVRMAVASFLVKHQLIAWQEGERWFWDTLVDADAANNAASWQWVAGSGADAAPYFRIFNPITQGRKFDPDGVYVRKWVPELAKLPDAFIHAPFEATAIELAAAGVTLGRTYPAPIIEHKFARDRALAALQSIKAGEP